MDGSCSLALAQITACYAIISETNLHCSDLVVLSASVASACAASIEQKGQLLEEKLHDAHSSSTCFYTLVGHQEEHLAC